MRYFADDHEWIYGRDDDDNKFVFHYKTLKLEPTDWIDPYWGGVTEEYAKQRMAEIARERKAELEKEAREQQTTD